MQEIQPIAMPGTHKKFLEFFLKQNNSKNLKILDLGAGHGAFSQKLYNLGFDVQACDLFPEIFEFQEIECKKADATQPLPYADNSFDVVIAIEVSEHIADHEMFFSETNRILKPNGKLYISTPNILSLKSRMRFLMSGFFYSFNPLEMNNYDGLQHVSSLTLDQYNYLAVKNNFTKAEIEIDKKQSTSTYLLVLLYPILFLYRIIKKVKSNHNQTKLLLGRILFLTFNKN